jgi:hypothetical protein
MRLKFALSIALLCVATIASAGEPSRSYIFSGRATAADCAQLPAPSFQILPSLDRSGTSDRLIIECVAGKDGPKRIQLTFTLRDAVVLPRPRPGTYVFRWGARSVPDADARITTGEFTGDQPKCERILKLLKTHATAPSIASQKVSWSAGCYGEAHWGVVMEVTLTENGR